jgi:hypothetical protein
MMLGMHAQAATTALGGQSGLVPTHIAVAATAVAEQPTHAKPG